MVEDIVTDTRLGSELVSLWVNGRLVELELLLTVKVGWSLSSELVSVQSLYSRFRSG